MEMVLRQGRAVLSAGGVSTNPLWAPNLGVKDLCLRSLSPPELGDTGTKAGLKKPPQIYLHWLKKPKQNSAFSLTPSLKHLSVTFFVGTTPVSQVTGIILISHRLP